MKDEEFRKWFRFLIEWEPFPKDKARKMLDRILKILFGYRSQLLRGIMRWEKKQVRRRMQSRTAVDDRALDM